MGMHSWKDHFLHSHLQRSPFPQVGYGGLLQPLLKLPDSQGHQHQLPQMPGPVVPMAVLKHTCVSSASETPWPWITTREYIAEVEPRVKVLHGMHSAEWAYLIAVAGAAACVKGCFGSGLGCLLELSIGWNMLE